VLTLYGTSKSRASRSILALEELGLAYRHVPLGAELRDPGSEARALLNGFNPNGHIPVLVDDDFVIWESMAINLYLGAKHGGPLWPAHPRNLGLTFQWSLWAQTEVDRPDWNLARRSGDEARIARVTEDKVRALGVLDAALASAQWLAGDSFTMADLNVASTLSEPHEGGRIDWQRLDPFELGLPALGRWLERCTARASWRRVANLP
jgi:glutathione S-transferase